MYIPEQIEEIIEKEFLQQIDESEHRRLVEWLQEDESHRKAYRERVKVFYLDLPRFIPLFTSDKFPCYGTFLDGDNIYNSHLSRQGFVVMGNEGSGITPEVEKLVSYRLTIPSFTPAHDSTESLNVGVATGIILSEFKRNTNQY